MKKKIVFLVLLMLIGLINLSAWPWSNPFNGTSWRGLIGDHMTTFVFKESHVTLLTPTKTDEVINYPYSYSGNVATIDTGWEVIKATISGSIMKLIVGEAGYEFTLYKQ